ncbi:thiosulfate transmembrane transporter [Aureococcus anophagefferens]|nr:thiosulfate transmembrane transporter [Aureococcus anophagefferens]
MACYDQVKEELRRRCGLRDDVPSERYALQGAAAVAGLAITVARRRRRSVLWMASEPGTFRHLGHALGHIVATRGPGGLFRGFSAQWARFGPYALVHYFAWEQMRLLAGMRPL